MRIRELAVFEAIKTGVILRFPRAPWFHLTTAMLYRESPDRGIFVDANGLVANNPFGHCGKFLLVLEPWPLSRWPQSLTEKRGLLFRLESQD